MYLSELTLINFKNYTSAEVELNPKVNCFFGKNGSGKTNLLDAIYYLAFSKSFFNPSDSHNIKDGEGFFSIQAQFRSDDSKEKVGCSFKIGQKKVVSRNGKNYERFSDHIGLIPLVMISPIDILLIIEGSEVRRKWLDGIISQTDKLFLDHLLKYNKALAQRNQLLKQKGLVNRDLVDVFDQQLCLHGEALFDKRSEAMKALEGHFNHFYPMIGVDSEVLRMEYTSHLQENKSVEEQLRDSFEKDLRVQHTTRGIHKDDINFLLNDKNVKRFASQGQQKSVLLALRLAQSMYISESKSQKPLLLLDDVYDKLDEDRMRRLFDILKSEVFGQLIITDTDRDHMHRILDACGLEARYFEVNQGEVKTMEALKEEV